MLFQESQEDILSRQITNHIIQLIKFWDGDQSIKTFDINNIHLNIQIFLDDSLKNIRIIGETIDDKNINLMIKTPTIKINNKTLSSIYFKLLSVIRHELEHLRQFKTSAIKPTYDNDEFFSNNLEAIEHYLLDPREIEALATEIKLLSRKLNITFNDAFKERIKPFVNQLLQIKANKQKIMSLLSEVKQKIFQYAQKRWKLLTAENP